MNFTARIFGAEYINRPNKEEPQMNIIESIGNWGVKTTPAELAHIRLCRPKAGDIIDFGENEGNYPYIYGRYGRIDTIENGWVGKGEAHICCELGSPFLFKDGSVSI